jgi:LmbE family N-acetylglucosaminyl deacetylase
MGKSIMAIGAHHDDVELRCGGTVAKYKNEGWDVIYVVATTTPHYNPFEDESGNKIYVSNREVIEIRKNEARQGAGILGASEVHFLDFKSLYWYREGTRERINFDGIRYNSRDLVYLEQEIPGREYIVSAAASEQAVSFLEDFIGRRQVDIVLTHSADDSHWEHYAVARLVRYAVKRLVSKGVNIGLFHWEFGSGGPLNYGFAPTRYVDITGTIDTKCRAVSVFKSQVPGHDTGIMVKCARLRAAAYGNLCGCEYAEPFVDSNFEPAGFEDRMILPATYDPSKALKGLG